MNPSPRCRLAVLASLVCVLAPAAIAQRKPALTHDDYDKWPSIRSTAYSQDGKWIAYTVQPAWGDGVLHVQEVDGEGYYKRPLGTSPSFSADGRFLFFTKRKSVVKEREKQMAKLRGEKVKELEAENKKKEAEAAKTAEQRRAEMMARFRAGRGMRGFGRGRSGGSSGSGELFILNLKSGKTEKLEKLKGYRIVKDGEFLIYHLPAPTKKPAAKGDAKKAAGSASEKTAEKSAAERMRERRSAARGERGERGARRRGQGGQRGTRGRGMGRRRSTGRPTVRSAGSRPSSSSSSSREGTVLVVRELKTGKERRYESVVSYSLLAENKWLMLTQLTSKKDSKVVNGLNCVPLQGGELRTVLAGKASFRGMTTDRRHKFLAFTSDLVEKAAADKAKKAADAKKKAAAKAAAEAKEAGKKVAAAKPAAKPATKRPRADVYLWDFGDEPAKRIITHDTKGLPEGYRLPSSVSFSRDASMLTFSITGKSRAPMPKILPDEKVVVDIWHWNDGSIQPMQAKGRGRVSTSRTAAFHIDEGRFVVLGDKLLPSVSLVTSDGSRAMASDSKPYEKLVTWDGRYSDYYMINTMDGTRTKFLEKVRNRPSPSPSGRYMLLFGADYQYHLIDVATMKKRCISKGVKTRWENELEDRPQPARAHGVVGWLKGEKEVLINDRYDIWRINVETGDAVCVTDGYGRANKIVLRNTGFDLEGDDDERDIDDRRYVSEKMLLSAKNDMTKARGYYLDSATGMGKPKKVVMLDDNIGGLRRAKKADRIFFTLSDFDQFPDLWVANLDFTNMRKLTDACPQMRQHRWGSSELVNWTNSDGEHLQGYLVKPEGFDPKKKYPMMVYFYERNADNVHRYTAPSPGTSPNAAYYVSNGYLWFVPDIIYTVGYPGESSEKCVISGVQHLIAQGFVDRKAIGMAGHSWGGYQTAHLVTRTNLFAAAESGAPVSNMFSAYGGIRYSSGMSRQFQYERTQSRIGGTPWQYPQRYWQNSPVFYADRVQTPVLILHNDQDGAVPWTNGIEFFMALRRMGKEAYLFNYNGAGHGLRKMANRRDWARRMQEFFDHHLKGKKAPKWMTDGVPYSEREREKIQYTKSFRENEARKKVKAVEAASSSSTSGSGTK